MSRTKGNRIIGLSLILAGLGLLTVALAETRAQAADSLTVVVNRPPDGSEILGFKQSFPHPNLSIISVTNQNGTPVVGLANSERWLDAHEVAENGRLISEIWQPLLEYQQNNPAFPADPDLYHQRPGPKFLEVCEDCGPVVPISVTLLMDMSSSLRDDNLELAKRGLTIFVNKMRPEDRAGVIQFADTMSILPTLPMTSDKNAIIDFINSATTRDWTPLYRALELGLRQVKFETNARRCIVIYTDGRNALPEPEVTTFTPDSVIVNAQKHQIPIFTIALGKNTNETVLKRVAEETGGLFFKTVDGGEFEEIYDEISQVIRNYYAISYTSPDPCTTDSVRVLDVTVNTTNGTGRGLGAYAYSGAPQDYDLAVELNSQTENPTLCVGDEIIYSLTITNLGPNPAFNVRLQNIISEFVTPEADFSLAPTSMEPNALFWQLDSLGTGEKLNISFTARVNSNVPNSTTALTSLAKIISSCDVNPDNNVAEDVNIYDPAECFLDISVMLSTRTDSLVTQGPDSLWFAKQGETYPYVITVRNMSRFFATDVILTDVLPDSIQAGMASAGDTLSWDLGTIAPFTDTTLAFDATLAQRMPEGINVLINRVSVRAFNEDPARLENNSDVDTVYNYVEPRLSDLAIYSTARTDSFVVSGTDTLWFATQGETFSYFITVSNNAKYQAENVTVVDVLADSLSAGGFSAGDSIHWELESLAPFSDTTFTFEATLASPMPEGINVLINKVSVRAFNEDPARLENNSDVDTVYNYVEPRLSDMAIYSTARTDSFVVSGTDTLWFATQGETFSYFITVSNNAKYQAENVTVVDVLADSLSAGEFSAGDSIYWELASLAPFSDTTFTFEATLASPMPEGLNLHINRVLVRAENENPLGLSDNAVADTVFNYIEPRFADLVVLSRVKTDSFSVQGADTLWFAQAGETYSYYITVSNDAKYEAENVLLTGIFPDLVKIDKSLSGKTIEWRLGNLPPFSQIQIVCKATVSTELGPDVVELVHSVEGEADNENPDKLENNFASNSVFTVPPTEGCNLFYLDVNVYEPETGRSLGINFELNSSRSVRLDLYDLSGYHVTKMLEASFITGQNRFEWNGRSENGQEVGSGVYVITFRSDNLVCWKKVIVAR